MITAVLIVNVVLALATSGFGIAAAIKPESVADAPVEPGSPARFYSLMYAVRAVPFGIAAALASVHGIVEPQDLATVTAPWLLVAAIIQFADIAIGVQRKEKGLIGGAAAFGLVHFLGAILAALH